MVLDVNHEKSLFFNLRKFISDSTMTEDAKKGLMTMPDQNIQTRYIIKKNSFDSKVSLITDEFSTAYKFVITDERKLNWKLLPQKETILSYECQKAELIFGGRIWYAWFTEKIPIHDGPYKFRSLPGLIVKIEDSKGYHSFQLKEVKKRIPSPIYNNIDKGKNIRNFTINEFTKFYKDYRKDPAKEFKQRAMSGEIYYESEEKRSEHIRTVEKLRKDRIKKDNNIIEIDMIKQP
jgi:GLPGLI family protein